MSLQRGSKEETEIKLMVSDVATMVRDLRRMRATERGRVFERNTIYDTPQFDFRRRGWLLRLRTESPAGTVSIKGGRKRSLLTSKTQPSDARKSRFKRNLESELELVDSRHWPRMLRSIGLQAGFRYEKYRTSFRLDGVELSLDETPVGLYLEMEGAPQSIDDAARALGFSTKDYILDTYWDIYSRTRRRGGTIIGNMVFNA